MGRTLWKLGTFSKRAVLWNYKMELMSSFISVTQTQEKSLKYMCVLLNLSAQQNIWGTFKGCGDLKWCRKVSFFTMLPTLVTWLCQGYSHQRYFVDFLNNNLYTQVSADHDGRSWFIIMTQRDVYGRASALNLTTSLCLQVITDWGSCLQ